MTEPLRYVYGYRTVSDLINLQQNGHLNLEPGFQRDSVWTKRDRQYLIQSVLDGYPVPSIFLYKREENGWPVYDVLDGKQRLETLFMYARADGFRRRYFDEKNGQSSVKYQFGDGEEEGIHDWKKLCRAGRSGRILSYSIQTVEVSGELSNIIDLFVRINSTGKALTSSEKRNAKFFKTPFLQEAARLAKRFGSYLLEQHVISESQASRMKDVELMSELLASIAHGGPIHAKSAVDKAVSNESMRGQTLHRLSRELTSTLNALKKIFPDLSSSRFKNTSEFYSLMLVVHEWLKHGFVLKDTRRNKVAAELLRRFSHGVDEVRELQKHAKGAGPNRQLYTTYLISVQRGTDELGQRTRRAEILRSVFAGIFGRKDEQRAFSVEQRRILWHSDAERKCSCGQKLSWGSFHVDHKTAHSRGGRTILENAKLLCPRCNLSKGAKIIKAS